MLEGVRDRDRQRFDMQLAGEDWALGRRLLLSNAQEQAREGGVALSEDVVEDAVAKSINPTQAA